MAKTPKDVTQGRTGFGSTGYRNGDPAEPTRPKTPKSRFKGRRGTLKAGRPNSALVYDGDPGDPSKPESKGATERTYQENQFDPATETEDYSYTAGRVVKRVYNKYGPVPQGKTVFGYYTDWSQYDGRLEGIFTPGAAGRGVDMMLIDAAAYDKIIIGFAGIVGDKGEKRYTIDNAAVDFGKKLHEATFVDPWGDVASYLNVGFEGWVSNDYQELFDQSKAQGVLGGLRKLKEKNPNLKLSFSLGGWTMSEAYHELVQDSSKRRTLVDSLAFIIEKFPMFSEIDLDWEYPGMPGNGNPHGPLDAQFFQTLVREIKQRLPNIRISIAAGASMATLLQSDIKGMIESGVEGINLMTYDFFGTPWATGLAHHTNLYDLDPSNPENFSIERAVDYLLEQGVPSTNINIGYAAYSRSARNAVVTSWSPLAGTYSPGSGTTTGTFESGSTEFFDILYNYVDFENQTGINGFNVYTDEVADADYLYSPESGLFLSIDTPRSVYAKGEYVRQKNLGGLFTWTIDQDSGVLANAAREGLGATAQTRVVDMAPFYFKGINVQDSGRAPVAVIEGPTEAFEGDEVSFSALRSIGDELTYTWSAPNLTFIEGKTTPTVSGTLPSTVRTYTITLTVKDASGRTSTTTQTLKVKSHSTLPPTSRISVLLEAGTPFALSGEASFDSDNDPLTYLWDAPDLPFNGSTAELVEGTAPSVDEQTDFWVKLTVNDGEQTDQSAIFLTVVPSETPSGGVVAKITGRLQVEAGAPISLSGVDSTGPAPLLYAWAAPGLSFDGADTISVSANAPIVDRDTTKQITLTVKGSGGTGASDSDSVELLILAGGSSGDEGTWRPEGYPGDSVVTHNYNGQGLHQYKAKWWASAADEPGDPNVTSTVPEGDDKVWYDMGPV